MSYNPKTNWQDSEIVYATDMNRIEQGISDADVGLGNVQAEVTAHKADGTQHAKSSKFVVGTSTAGWTSADCDYLCDGTADQAEINAAITALPAAGGEIVILEGTYNITAKIDITKDNVSIRGNGNATILKRMFDSDSPEGLITLISRYDCKIANLRVDGNNMSYSDGFNLGIYLKSSSYNTIADNTITATNYTGIFLASSSNNAIIGNTYYNNESGIALISSFDNTITDNTCNNNGSYGIHLDSSNSNIITGNACNNINGGLEGHTGIYLESLSTDNTITDNTCNNNGAEGILIEASDNNSITGNACNNSNYGITIIYSSNNIITGNACNNNIRTGIFLPTASNNTITGNACNNNGAEGIHLTSSNNNTITGNTCIRGTGLSTDYTANQHTIFLSYTNNNYNLISNNNCMGKAVTSEGGTGNTLVNNKFDVLYAPADYIVERGVTDGWTWEKYANGECVAKKTAQRGNYFTTTVDNIRVTDPVLREVPSGLFTTVTDCNISTFMGDEGAWIIPHSFSTSAVLWKYATVNSEKVSVSSPVTTILYGTWK